MKGANTTSEPKKVATPTNTNKAARSKVALRAKIVWVKTNGFSNVARLGPLQVDLSMERRAIGVELSHVAKFGHVHVDLRANQPMQWEFLSILRVVLHLRLANALAQNRE